MQQLCDKYAKSPYISARTPSVRIEIGAGDGDRTRDPLLGKHDPDTSISGISGQGLGLAYERVNSNCKETI
jgi:hypothetical protein